MDLTLKVNLNIHSNSYFEKFKIINILGDIVQIKDTDVMCV